MSEPYPIVLQRPLSPVAKSGILGLGTKRRAWEEVPLPKPDQVRVYLVDGRHVIDHGRLELDDETVVRATSISIVDLTRNREVPVELTIPSADAKQFTVRVTFHCTVIEPDTVVRVGHGDATSVLLGYLHNYQKLFQLGLDHKISAINRVRLFVQTQMEAYYQHVRPDTPGMQVILANVEVLTPEELVPIYHSRFETEETHITETARAGLGLEMDQMRARHQEQMEMLRQQTELERKKYELILAQQQHTVDASRQLGQHTLATNDNRFAAGQANEIVATIGNDPWKASYFALQKDEGSAAEIAAGLQAAQVDAETRRRQLEDHELAQRQAALEHKRELDERTATWDREDRVQGFVSRLDVVKELAKHGHLDEVTIDEIDTLMDRWVGKVPKQSALPDPPESTAAKPELESSSEDDAFPEDET
jgi:hypothetical protein